MYRLVERAGGLSKPSAAASLSGYHPASLAWVEVLDALRDHPEGHAATEQRVRREIFALCERFPIY